MAKVITIGRGDEADINIDNDLVSRRHATIRILPSGKMEIRDLSKNGTFINGIRLPFNKPYPVTRKDIVSFAHSAQLDWNMIPDPMKPYRIGGGILIALILIAVVFFVFAKMNFEGGIDEGTTIETPYEEAPSETIIPPADEDVNNQGQVVIPDKYPDLFPKDKKKKDKDNNDKTEENTPEETPPPAKQENTPETQENPGNGNNSTNWML